MSERGPDRRRGVPPRLSVAPMMERTDRHYRWLVRQITRRTLLYTEMVTSGAVLHGERERLLAFDPVERPLALQLAGDDPEELAACARIGAALGYDEINLNVGCPSERVQQGRFGACLMAEPGRVARAVEAMRGAVSLPVTVKHRIGIDELDRYEDLAAFVRCVAQSGCDRFIVHARKAWLTGLSPKENRSVPPLRWEDVHRLKREEPQETIEINGGFTTLAAVRRQLELTDGVMIGRGAYDDPFMLAGADAEIFGDPGASAPTRRAVAEALADYVETMRGQGVPAGRVLRHALGLMAGQPGARAWRRVLTRESARPDAGAAVVRAALGELPADVLDAPAGRAAPPVGA